MNTQHDNEILIENFLKIPIEDFLNKVEKIDKKLFYRLKSIILKSAYILIEQEPKENDEEEIPNFKEFIKPAFLKND